MISRTTASTPPPPPPPVSTTVVCSRVTSSRSSAIGNSPLIALLLWQNERTGASPVPECGGLDEQDRQRSRGARANRLQQFTQRAGRRKWFEQNLERYSNERTAIHSSAADRTRRANSARRTQGSD